MEKYIKLTNTHFGSGYKIIEFLRMDFDRLIFVAGRVDCICKSRICG